MLTKTVRSSEEEVSQRTWQHLSAADSNGNQQVTLDEIEALRLINEDHVLRPDPQTAFALLDINDNDGIEESEVTAATWSKMVHADTNSDSSISSVELAAAHQADEANVDGSSAELSLAAFSPRRERR